MNLCLFFVFHSSDTHCFHFLDEEKNEKVTNIIEPKSFETFALYISSKYIKDEKIRYEYTRNRID
jgi:hypothetical protein